MIHTGSLNDSSVFQDCNLKQGIVDGFIKLPEPAKLKNSDITCPYHFIADAGFPLQPYLMTPYSRLTKLSIRQRIFNYRLSRSRLIVETGFGLLKSKWRIFNSPLGWKLDNAETIILATICLHNYLITIEMGEKEKIKNTNWMNNPLKKMFMKKPAKVTNLPETSERT